MKVNIDESLSFIKSTTDLKPEAVLVLGTGLKDCIGDLDESVTIPYSQIPHFPTTTAPTHEGSLLIGKLSGYPLAVMRGRHHYYEGYSMKEITYPLRTLNALGAKTLIVTNAAGGLNIHFKNGDVVIITDHINLMGDNPLRGPEDGDLDSRFPVMTQTYTPELMDMFCQACVAEKVLPRQGVYVAVPGPNFETPAELRFLHSAGGDLVGMSTVPEVIMAVYLKMKVLGISVVSNMAIFLPEKKKHQDPVEKINKTSEKAAKTMRKIFKRFFKELNNR